MAQAQHTCNAYCRAPEHCDLVLSEAKATPDTIAQGYGYAYRVHVNRVLPAREAPGLDELPREALEPVTTAAILRPADATRWLVYWREV